MMNNFKKKQNDINQESERERVSLFLRASKLIIEKQKSRSVV